MGAAGGPPTPTTSRRRWRIRPCAFRDRFSIPVPDDQLEQIPYIKPAPGSAEQAYFDAAIQRAGGHLPRRPAGPGPLATPPLEAFASLLKSSEGREFSTTLAFVRLLGQLLKDPGIGKRVVPIVPDESRTFGMDAMFRQVGIYSHVGQLYAAGRRPAQCLPRGPPGADPAGRHQRVRRHGILDRGRHGAQHAWAGDDPVLHLLFDVRLPARGRPGLGRRRHPRARFPPGRDLGPHHAGRRGPAARRRPQPRAGLGDPVVPRLRPGLCLRDRGDRAGRHAAHVPGTGRRLLLPDPDQRKDRASGHARRRRGRHPEGHASRARGRAG